MKCKGPAPDNSSCLTAELSVRKCWPICSRRRPLLVNLLLANIYHVSLVLNSNKRSYFVTWSHVFRGTIARKAINVRSRPPSHNLM